MICFKKENKIKKRHSTIAGYAIFIGNDFSRFRLRRPHPAIVIL